MKRLALAFVALSAVVVLGACLVPTPTPTTMTETASASPTATTCAWSIHGLIATADGTRVAGATMTLTRVGAGEIRRSESLATGNYGWSVSCTSGTYVVLMEVAPAGYAVVGSDAITYTLPTDSAALTAGGDFELVLAEDPTPPQIPTETATATTSPTPIWATVEAATATPTDDSQARETATPKPTETPEPGPTRVCRGGYIQVEYADRLNIRGMALQRLYHLEDMPDPVEDVTLVYGFREFNTPPLSQAFAYVTADNVALQCRAYTDGIIVIDECRPLCPVGVVSWDAAWSFPDQIYEEGQ